MKFFTIIFLFFSFIFAKSQDKNLLSITAKVEKDSVISVLIKNLSSDTLSILNQDSNFFIIKEAKNFSGDWKPLEYWVYSTCGNSYFDPEILPPTKTVETEKEYSSGDFETQLRLKFLFKDEIYYSNICKAKINPKSFDFKEKLISDPTYKKVLRFGDEQLAEKYVLLDPSAQKEFAENYKKWLEGFKEKNKDNHTQ